MKALLTIAILFIVCNCKSQSCQLASVVKTYDLDFTIDCPDDIKTTVTIIDTDSNVVFTQKVRIKKGESRPVLHFKPSEPGIYVIKIGEFYRKEMEL